MFRLCVLVHILILHVLSFQNPIYCYPYYSLVYIVGFYLTEYKLVSPSSQSSSKLHRTDSCCTVISLYSLRTIVKVLSTCCSSSSFVVLRRFSSYHCRSSSFFVISRHRRISTFSRSRLGRTGDPALYPHFAILVLVFIGDSVICALAGVSFGAHHEGKGFKIPSQSSPTSIATPTP